MIQQAWEVTGSEAPMKPSDTQLECKRPIPQIIKSTKTQSECNRLIPQIIKSSKTQLKCNRLIPQIIKNSKYISLWTWICKICIHASVISLSAGVHESMELSSFILFFSAVYFMFSSWMLYSHSICTSLRQRSGKELTAPPYHPHNKDLSKGSRGIIAKHNIQCTWVTVESNTQYTWVTVESNTQYTRLTVKSNTQCTWVTVESNCCKNHQHSQQH